MSDFAAASWLYGPSWVWRAAGKQASSHQEARVASCSAAKIDTSIMRRGGTAVRHAQARVEQDDANYRRLEGARVHDAPATQPQRARAAAPRGAVRRLLARHWFCGARDALSGGPPAY